MKAEWLGRYKEKLALGMLLGLFFCLPAFWGYQDYKNNELRYNDKVIALIATVLPCYNLFHNEDGSLLNFSDTWLGKISSILSYYESGEYKKAIVQDFENGYIMIPDDAENIQISKPDWEISGENFVNVSTGQEVSVERCSRFVSQARNK